MSDWVKSPGSGLKHDLASHEVSAGPQAPLEPACTAFLGLVLTWKPGSAGSGDHSAWAPDAILPFKPFWLGRDICVWVLSPPNKIPQTDGSGWHALSSGSGGHVWNQPPWAEALWPGPVLLNLNSYPFCYPSAGDFEGLNAGLGKRQVVPFLEVM